MPELTISSSYPPKIDGFFDDNKRFYILYGGRGSAKSWSVAQHLIEQCLISKHRVLCAREIQLSIKQSVKKLLVDSMEKMGCRKLFVVRDQFILCPLTGSEILFTGLFNNEETIKSMEGITIVWIEEAQAVSHRSMETLIPTIRAQGSYIILTMNPRFSTDWSYQEFIEPETIRPDAKKLQVNFSDNPWFEDTELVTEEKWMRMTNPGKHRHVWLGSLNLDDDALVFKGNVFQQSFQTPPDAEFMFGQDYGFSNDPMAFVRSWLSDDERTLFVDEEAGGMTELDLFDHPEEMDKLGGSRRWPIKADSARPEYISWLARQGFAISGTTKYKGSVEDGISWLQSVNIVVHPRCMMTFTELSTHKFERHRQTDEVTRKPEDKNNHFIDALRYAWQEKWMKQQIWVGGN